MCGQVLAAKQCSCSAPGSLPSTKPVAHSHTSHPDLTSSCWDVGAAGCCAAFRSDDILNSTAAHGRAGRQDMLACLPVGCSHASVSKQQNAQQGQASQLLLQKPISALLTLQRSLQRLLHALHLCPQHLHLGHLLLQARNVAGHVLHSRGVRTHAQLANGIQAAGGAEGIVPTQGIDSVRKLERHALRPARCCITCRSLPQLHALPLCPGCPVHGPG